MVAVAGRVTRSDAQYTLTKILGIWAVVSLPMAVLAWVIRPALQPYTTLHPGILHWMLMVVGMMWQFVVALLVLRAELGGLRWADVRTRIWLNGPRDPATGVTNRRLYWWVLPALLASFLAAVVVGPYLDAALSPLLTALGVPRELALSSLADRQFHGQWWLVGLALTSALFNYLLGEELLFRGVLLPKMAGVFGRWDWVANAVLFGLYHLHKPYTLLSIILSSLAITWPARRFRSNWMAIIVHGVEASFVLLVLGIVLGYAP